VFVLVAVAVGSLVGGLVAAERRRAEIEAARIAALESVDRQRTALLRSVSHDLRTPLATIRAVATDLHADTDYDAGTRRELLSLVADEAERLDRLVANLLSMSRIEAGSLLPERQPVDVGELVEACLGRLHRLVSNVHLALQVAPDLPLVAADWSQLDQVLTNLVENATRHSPPGGSVTVTATRSTEPATPGGVRIVVGDDGPGVDVAHAARLFEPFVTGDHGRGASSGIGLAICKAIVDAHGGVIAVGPAASGGAAFSVDLPAWDER
jgi:two-component system sensor histidine kinase KdpD